MYLKLNLIVAACDGMGIGKNGELPWRLKKEMAHFVKLTMRVSDSNKRNAVIMGRKTWESIPVQFRPLKNRLNVVLTRDKTFQLDESVLVCNSLDIAVETLTNVPYSKEIENIWVIGGNQVYRTALESKYSCRIYLTRIFEKFDCDTFFPNLEEKYAAINDPDVTSEVQEECGTKYEYKVYEDKV